MVDVISMEVDLYVTKMCLDVCVMEMYFDLKLIMMEVVQRMKNQACCC